LRQRREAGSHFAQFLRRPRAVGAFESRLEFLRRQVVRGEVRAQCLDDALAFLFE
jgi:hypothetical protein